MAALVLFRHLPVWVHLTGIRMPGEPWWELPAERQAAHIARAALESIAYQTMDVLKAMEADAGVSIKELRVDGGATANNLLMQFQAEPVKL